MRAAVIFGSIILFFVIFIIVPSFIYVKIYQGRINKRMRHIDEKKGKSMLEPVRFCIIWSAVVVILTILFIIIINNSSNSHTSDTVAAYAFEVFEGDEINNSYMANFSMEENTGYIKTEKEEKNFRVTAFYSKEDYDGLHPNFIVYVQCMDSEKYAAQDINGDFCDYSGSILAGKGYAGGNGDKIICFAGYVRETTEYSEYFEGHVYYMDEENMELSKKNDDKEGKYINTGCMFTLDFNDKSIDMQIVE